MIKKAFILSIIIVLCLCLLSCKEMNSSPSITEPQVSGIEEQTPSKGIYENYIYPKEWKETIHTSAGVCTIDSKISMNNKTYPIYRVSPDFFVTENLQDILNSLHIAYEVRNIAIPFKERILSSNNEEITINLYHNYLSVQRKEYGLIQLEDWVIAGNAYPGEPAGTKLENVKISEADAIHHGNSLLSTLGIEHMALGSITKARVIGENNNTVTEGWYLSYALNIGEYIPVDLSRISMPGDMYFELGEYFAPWARHELQMFVDIDGVQFFKWKNKLKINDLITENARLLPFEEIQEVARRYIQQGYSNEPALSIEDLPTVTQIILTSCLVQDDSDSLHGILMPTWVFYFNTPSYEEKHLNPFALFVNALNGKRMDPLIRQNT